MFKSFFKDSLTGYGWSSILLHWVTAVIIITMLFLGDSIAVSGRETLMKHITMGLVAYPLLWLRIILRLVLGHPNRLPSQKNPWLYRIAVWTHYVLIAALAVLLITGPLIAISRGGYDFVVLSAIKLPGFLLRAPDYHIVHAYAAGIIAVGIAIHVLAVIKHAVWNRDGTFEKMIIPNNGENQARETRSSETLS